MDNFWESELGQITGDAKDAFTPDFGEALPDNTQAIAQIAEMKIETPNANSQYSDGLSYINVKWAITAGDFSGRVVFQKLHVLSKDNKKRHRSLNMLMRMYQMFGMQPPAQAPTNEDLMQFVNRYAGIKIRETQPDGMDKTINFISEVHPAQNYECKTGTKIVVTQLPSVTPSNQGMQVPNGMQNIPSSKPAWT